MNQIEQANSVLKKRFKTDKDFRHSYVANIAMSFKDEYSRVKKREGRPLNNEEIHEVANTAAENFLNLWLS